MTDIFLPTMMNASAIDSTETSWFRTLVWMKPGIAVEPVRDRLQAVFRAFREEQAKGFTGRPKLFIDRFLNESLLLEPAAAGVSDMQKEYRQPLAALGVLVALVLLIACANVANLMTAHAAARSREWRSESPSARANGVLCNSCWSKARGSHCCRLFSELCSRGGPRRSLSG